MYCLGCRFVTALTPLTSAPATGFPFVESNPIGIPNFFINSISFSSIAAPPPPSPPPSTSLTSTFSIFSNCFLAIPSTKSDTAALCLSFSLSLSLSLSSSVSRRWRFLGGEGEGVRWCRWRR
uniref:Uncharacterized protein n=1 Tax=Rhizophora mucronata TaxID=61149 RepID=A0A2P2JF91_RHIMU